MTVNHANCIFLWFLSWETGFLVVKPAMYRSTGVLIKQQKLSKSSTLSPFWTRFQSLVKQNGETASCSSPLTNQTHNTSQWTKLNYTSLWASETKYVIHHTHTELRSCHEPNAVANSIALKRVCDPPYTYRVS
jgi:hypothetical protein